MEDLADRTDRSCVISILPYRLRALKRRHQAARAAALSVLPAPPAFPARHPFQEQGTMRGGIRHIASGRMTVIDAGPQAILSMLTARATDGRGVLQDERLEAIAVDRQKRVFAGFWL
jgi:hypothetical protein